eukprot:scaffold166231_cov36-Tisochrysis_lutea.AAC.2
MTSVSVAFEANTSLPQATRRMMCNVPAIVVPFLDASVRHPTVHRPNGPHNPTRRAKFVSKLDTPVHRDSTRHARWCEGLRGWCSHAKGCLAGWAPCNIAGDGPRVDVRSHEKHERGARVEREAHLEGKRRQEGLALDEPTAEGKREASYPEQHPDRAFAKLAAPCRLNSERGADPQRRLHCRPRRGESAQPPSRACHSPRSSSPRARSLSPPHSHCAPTSSCQTHPTKEASLPVSPLDVPFGGYDACVRARARVRVWVDGCVLVSGAVAHGGYMFLSPRRYRSSRALTSRNTHPGAPDRTLDEREGKGERERRVAALDR